jgi:membrane fusion protein (multidrug efflux system)
MKKWMFWMLVVATLLFGSVFGFYQFKQVMMRDFMASMPVPSVPVTAMTVAASDWVPMIHAIGFIEPENGVTLSTAEAGVVSEIKFSSGQQVEQGELLVKLDSGKEAADLRSAQSRLTSVRAESERQAKLARDSLVTQSVADAAAADYQSLRAQIDSLNASIERREIRAPFSGVTGINLVQLGQYLQTGTEVVRLDDIHHMKIRFIISEKNYPKVSVGMAVDITVSAYPGRVFAGKINAIDPAIDYKSGVVQLQAVIPNDELLLRAGMYAEVNIRQPTLTQQVVIPQRAITFALYGETVYVLDSTPSKQDGQPATSVARQVTVKVAERRDSLALISEGLKPGEVVVTSGQLKLANGTQVKVVADDTLAPPEKMPRL